MEKIAVVYIARRHDVSWETYEQFFASYREHPSGQEHDFFVILKGCDNAEWKERLKGLCSDIATELLELPDDGFDLGAYFRAADKLPHEWCCFLNSNSTILADNWLSILFNEATKQNVGAVSASGSWGTVTNFLSSNFFSAVKFARVKTAIKLLFRMANVAVKYWPSLPMFPNPHIRTNGFIVRRSLWLKFYEQSGIPPTKLDCYILEHGRKNFTKFLARQNLDALVVGADGRSFLWKEWPESGTFASPGLPNLLISDNQSELYLASPSEQRRQFEMWAWGRQFTPQAEDEPNDRKSALQSWRRVPSLIIAEAVRIIKKFGLQALRMLCPPIDRKYTAYENLHASHAGLQNSYNKIHMALARNVVRYRQLRAEKNFLLEELKRAPNRFCTDYTLLRLESHQPEDGPQDFPYYVPSPDLVGPYFAPIQVKVSSEGKYATPHVNIFLPSASLAHTSGGPNTVYTLAAELVKNRIAVRIVGVTASVDADLSGIYEHIANIGGITLKQANQIEILDASNRGIHVCLGENDIFLATAWWTAQMIKYILPQFREQDFIYLIQDFEPLIHNASINYALALETYSMNMLPIFNSSLLRDYFIREKIGRFVDDEFAATSLHFEPAVDRELFYPPVEKGKREKKRLLFYARPEAPRNLLEVGICALMKVITEKHCAPEQWEFFSTDTGVGGQCRPIVLSDNPEVVLTPLPLHKLTQWAEEMRNVDVMLSLIMSPHTSYPPLEAAACGATVVTNTWSVKTAERLLTISPNIVADDFTIEGVARALSKAMSSCNDPERAASDRPLLTFPSSWSESWRPVIPNLLAFLEGKGISPQEAVETSTPENNITNH